MRYQILNNIFIFFIIILFTLSIFIFFEFTHLNPDYLAYKRLYNVNFNYGFCTNILKCYDVIIFFFDKFNNFISYNTFRIIFLLSGLTFFLIKFIKNFYYSKDIVSILFFFFVLAFIILEFYIIRLRSGFSLLFFFLSIELFNNRYVFLKYLSIPLLLISFLLHPGSFLVFSFFFILIYSNFNKILIGSLVFFFLIALFYYNNFRDFSSPLNNFRFLLNYFFIMALFIFHRLFFTQKPYNLPEFIIFIYTLFISFFFIFDIFYEFGEILTRATSLFSVSLFYWMLNNKNYKCINSYPVLGLFTVITSFGFFKSIYINLATYYTLYFFYNVK